MKDNQFVLICPIYPPDFKYGQYLYYQSLLLEIQVCFVFTTHEDEQLFISEVCKEQKLSCLSIILEDIYTNNQLERLLEKRSFPTFKKFVAIDQLKSQFDFLICIDAETILLTQDWSSICHKLLNRKIWFGGGLTSTMRDAKKIMQSSATELVPIEDHEKIKRLTFDYNFYNWWWDIPVYYSSDVSAFLHWLNWYDTESVINRLTWYSFDHSIYQFYTVLYQGFKFVKVNDVIHSLEFSSVDVYQHVKQDFEAPTWINCRAFLQDSSFAKENNMAAIYHIDRVSMPEFDLMSKTTRAHKANSFIIRIVRRLLVKMLSKLH
ncbi:hypothetical protein V7S76_12685 [Aquirufa sp. ROCK2-A2]